MKLFFICGVLALLAVLSLVEGGQLHVTVQQHVRANHTSGPRSAHGMVKKWAQRLQNRNSNSSSTNRAVVQEPLSNGFDVIKYLRLKNIILRLFFNGFRYCIKERLLWALLRSRF